MQGNSSPSATRYEIEKKPGEIVTSQEFIIDNASVVAEEGAERFNIYEGKNQSIATGLWSHAEGEHAIASNEGAHAEGMNTHAQGIGSHAEGNQTVASGEYSHAEGTQCNATANYGSHAEGWGSTASGTASHAEGGVTTASGHNSHAEGGGSIASGDESHAEGVHTIASKEGAHAEGHYTKAQANFSHAEGENSQAQEFASHAEGMSTLSSGTGSHAEGRYTTASNYASHASGKFSKAMTDGGGAANTVGDAFVIGNGTSASSLSNCFRVTYAGAVYGLSAFNSSGADYAEYFEWLDRNLADEDRVGYFVTLLGEKIVKAKAGDYILGVVSGQPCIIGNADEDWLHRWEHDEFGRFIKEDTYRSKKDENGQPIEGEYELDEFSNRIVDGWRYKQNPEYDPSQQYIERKDRKEWSAVGMLGVLAVRDDGSCVVNGYAQVTDQGTATKAEVPAANTYRVIKRVSNNVVQIIFR